MTAREAGFVVARGLAAYLMTRSIVSLTGVLTSFAFRSRDTSGLVSQWSWPSIAAYVAYAGVYFLLAGVLWRNAERFGEPMRGGEAGEPLRVDQTFRIVIAGIACFWMFESGGAALNTVSRSFVGYFEVWRFIPDLIVLIISTIVFLIVGRGFTASRLAAYPRSEPDDKV